MNWDAIGAVGEWAGAISVFATLLYLAKQVQSQNKTARYSAWQSLQSEFIRFNEKFVENPDVYWAFVKGLENPDELTENESALFQATIRNEFNGALMTWKAFQEDQISEREWTGVARWYAHDFSTPGGRRFRELNLEVFPEFWESLEEHSDSGYRAATVWGAKPSDA